jgi:asparagine synthase (glutamine-hydrolysing)
MLAQIHHRGPDHTGVFYTEDVGLGHARLSVIDLSPAAHQPMASQDNRVQVVFNGEIYNHKALRKELESAGAVFRSQSDTEVIVHAYLRWGIDFVQRLRGMFAIGLYDAVQGCIYLLRDRVGKKPLFYSYTNGVLLFGSEPKAILAWPGFSRRPNLQAIHHYLSLQYIPSPLSAFEGISKLPPASYVHLNKAGSWRLERYWSLPAPNDTQPVAMRASEAQEALREILDESVRLRLESDVPLGAFLSGGVDSSAVVALMAPHTSGRVKTFCIGFDEPDYDERRYARMVADRYATDHQEMVVRPDALAILPHLTWHYNEPFADPSAVPTYYVSQIARQQVTVVLNGDGGDESFLGYGRYRQCYQTDWVHKLPKRMRQPIAAMARKMPPASDQFRPTRVARRWMSYFDELESVRYAPWMFYFSEADKHVGYGHALRAFLSEPTTALLQPYFDQSPQSFSAGAAWADIHTYLPDDLLVKVDVASMAHGLEARSPFLDHELMQWAARLPISQKIDAYQTKKLLKKTLEPLLPLEVLYRPKMGFGVPIDQWIRGPLNAFLHETLLSPKALGRGLIQEDMIRTMLVEHERGIRQHHTRLWGLLMLELWFEMWIDSVTLPERPTPLCLH